MEYYSISHLGISGRNNWKEIKDVELVGFYDPNDVAAQEVSEIPGTAFLDPKTFNGCQVDIGGMWLHHISLQPYRSHRKGKHVLEKPLAVTMEEAREILNLVRRSEHKTG